MDVQDVKGGPKNTRRQLYLNALKQITEGSDQAGIALRVFGSLAFDLRCPKFNYLQDILARAGYSDIDLAAYGKQAEKIQSLMRSLGYTENREVYVISEGQRAIYEKSEGELHVDVFYDKLDFCHVIHLGGRLELDSPSIPLAEMLLAKMQIIEINEKDVIDTIILLLEYPLGEGDHEMINMSHIARLCGNNWGLWRTTTMNLQKLDKLAAGYAQLPDDRKGQVRSQIQVLLERLDIEPKSLAWRVRAKVGDRVKWYKEVEEVE